MKRIILYIAISLNGKIADRNGEVGWLESIPNPDKLDYGFTDFMTRIDTTIQGGNTYRQLLEWNIGFPYKTANNYVVTNQLNLPQIGNVETITDDHVEFIKRLKESPGKDIWLIGGGKVNTLLLNAGLIDELILFIMPIILDGGIPLFADAPNLFNLKLKNSQTYSTGVQELKYKIVLSD